MRKILGPTTGLASSGTKVKWFHALFNHTRKGFLKKTGGGHRADRAVYGAACPQGRGTLRWPPHYQLHLLSQIYELLFLISEVAPDIHRSHPSPTYQLYLTCKHVIETHYAQKSISVFKRSPMTSMSIAPIWQLSFRSFTRSLPRNFCTQSACSVPSSYRPIQTKASRSWLTLLAFQIPSIFQRPLRPIATDS